MPITRLLEGDGFLIASWRNVLFRTGSGDPNAEHMAELHQCAAGLIAEYPEGIGFMLWLYDTAALPDGAGRSRGNEMFKDIGPKLQGFAAVVEGRGFWASAARSVLTGFSIVSRGGYSMKTFAAAHEAGDWLADRLVPTVSASELDEVIRELAEILPRPEAEAEG